ncbi:hypothetical protein KAFR_0E00970 [Kazachstania africana CBS 2517]|uniref:Uncharacterized protein n=1 Tax=Kazachstania africana (strain ATCC 22294 / BCRC 22015 / CBS 2517 / CECT 1963 / NBRC 1671 / NRRL Y-8276) TaxID=1071382 RepID=H2AV51_KAZAF|nr:hypothetical protein KAFR_0E00970 [Kazachstania africana CBS 2517]CCF58251.1 hypothetical protein KAFR_0E00970 [Kazachstania africana CBS 2517]
MQLRKRKKVDYSSMDEDHDEQLGVEVPDVKSAGDDTIRSYLPRVKTEAKDIPLQIIPRRNKPLLRISKPVVQSQGRVSNVKIVKLKRPSFLDRNDVDDDSRIVDVEMLESHAARLDRLIVLQNELYYKDLTGPKYMGPKHFEALRLPSDIKNLRRISQGLQTLISHRKKLEANADATETYVSKTSPGSMSHLMGLNNLTRFTKEEILNQISRIHNIDITDIKDIKDIKYGPGDRAKNVANGVDLLDSNHININEVKSISRKLDKELMKERDNSLAWPAKGKKKFKHSKKQANNRPTKFQNIPLYNLT